MLTATKRAERMVEIDREQQRIEDACTRENNGKFTDEQKKRHAALNAEWAELNRQEASEPLPRRSAVGSGAPLPSEPERKPQRSRWMNVATGAEVRVLNPEDRLSDNYPDSSELSFGRFMRGVITGNWRGADAEKMALANSTGTGSILVPDPLAAQWLDLARAQAVMFRAGMRTVDMEADSIRLAKLTSDPTFETKVENAAFSGSDVTIGQVQMFARTVGTVITMSREIAEDAPNAPEVVETALARGLAAAIDRLCLVGSTGSEGITGICYITGIPSTGSVAGIAWEDWHEAVTSIRALNYEPNAYIAHPTIAGDADILTSGDGTNSAKLWLGPPPSLNGVQRLTTTAITTAFGVAGDFTQCLFGMRTGALIETTTEADNTFQKHQVKVKITQRFDFAVGQPNAFHVLSGITT